MRIIDVIPFFNEVELLQVRLALLNGVVDTHVLIEADRTHRGDPKPSYLEGLTLPDNVVKYCVSLPDDVGPWERERIQRDVALEYLTGVEKDDLVIFTDCDELIDPTSIGWILRQSTSGPVSLAMRMFYYGLTWMDSEPWTRGKAARARHLRPSLTKMRRLEYTSIPSAGWHLSYWGGPARCHEKLRSYAHVEQDNEEMHELMDRANELGRGPNGESLVPADLTGVPELIRQMGVVW